MAEKCGKDNLGSKELAFLHVSCNCDQVGKNKPKKATPDAVTIKQPKTMFEFGLPSIIAYSPKNITVPRSVRFCRQFLQDSIHCHFLSKA